MTTLTINLPDKVAQQAIEAGLLAPDAVTQLFNDALRRQAGQQLMDIAQRLQAADIPPMSEEEIVAEVKAARAERRARQMQDRNADRP
jgi:hypothetical protein